MSLFAARLNQRIEILENVADKDLNDNWQSKFIVFAGVKPIGPNLIKFFEGVEFGALIDESYLIFTIRFNAQINKNMRILFKQKYFLIKKIINVRQLDKVAEIIAMEVS
jgi:head-tail adaptor